MEKTELLAAVDGGAAQHGAVALCAAGAEKAVSNELKKLGLHVTESGFGRVRFRADTAGLYRSLIGLRAADRILLEAGFFPAAGFDDLFDKTKAVPWERLVPADAGLKVVKVRSNRSVLKAETSIQSVVHKAAAEKLCGALRLKRLPETGGEAEVRVHIEKDTVSLLLDLSGEPLFKRGYRPFGGAAPLRETTAAAMLLLSGWKRKYPLYDPFCGSGTILAEALLYAWDMAPGLGRSFAISRLLIADKKIEETVRNEFRGRINFERTIRVAGSDEDPAMVKLALSNLRRAAALPGSDFQAAKLPEVHLPKVHLPKVNTLPMQKALPPFAAEGERPCGFIVTNPPYGKRLGDTETSQRIYKEMAVLARNFPGWKLAVITDHPGFESFFGRKAGSCREITGGPVHSYFFEFEELQ